MEILKQGPIIPETPLPEYLKMYDISGQDPITEHSFNRYIKDKEQDEAIRGQKENSLTFFIQQIKNVSEEERTSLIKLGLQNPDTKVQKASARMIWLAPEKEVISLIKLGLENPNIEVQKASAERIAWAPEGERTSLIKLVLENPNIEVQKASVRMIGSAPEEERTSLIKLALENPNIEVQKASADIITWAPEEEKASLRNMVLEKVKQGLESSDIKVQKASAEMIGSAPEGERNSLRNIVLVKIKQSLESPDIKVQKASVEMIGSAPEGEKQKLFNLIIEKELGEELIKSLIYKNSGVDDKPFLTQKFEKTGSETTLIGRFELKGKIIIRHIEPNAFLIWQRIYEDYNVWKNAGFDYVPIEPIISYKLKENGLLIDVFSGVLDLNLEEWKNKTDMFVNELEEQKNKIINVLDKLNIEHGHPHDSNFCLRFFRDTNGKIDFNNTPRLYLIDFDQAVSP